MSAADHPEQSDAAPTMDVAAAEPAAAAAESDEAAAQPAEAEAEPESSSSAAAAAVPAAASSSAALADLMDDDTDELALEAIAERKAQEDEAAAAAAAEDAAGGAETTEADAAAADTAMDDAAAAEGGEAAAAGGDADDDLESVMLGHCRSILASLSLAQVQTSSKSHMLEKLRAIMGKKIIKRNKELATKVAKQAASERLAELEKSGEDAAAEAEDNDARPLAEYKDAEDEDEEEEAPKKKAGKKRLRKSGGSDAEEDGDDDGDYAEGSAAKKKKPKKSTKKASSAAAAAASSEPASSTAALLAFESPKTPFQIFQSAERRRMKDEHPDATPAELGKLISAKWNDLDEDAKGEFEQLALKQKTVHAAELEKLRDEDPVAYEKHMKAVRKREEEQLLGPGGKKKKGGAHDDDGADPDHPLPAAEQSYFDSIISDLKPKKKTKKDYSSDEAIAHMREKEQAFIDKMINVAKLDLAAAESGKPAVHKLKMLPDVQAQLSKREVADRMMDSGLLRALCLWIAPESDGSLPNPRLRLAIYQILGTLRVTETSLASSQGLGKRIMRLWKDPAELLSNKRLLSELMEKWMRPMLGLSTDYAKASELEEERAQDIFRRKAIIDSAPKAPNYNPKRARIPEPARFDYAIRPQAANERENQDEAIEVGGGKPKKEESRKQIMQKRLDKMGKSGSIAKPRFKVDITGRASNL